MDTHPRNALLCPPLTNRSRFCAEQVKEKTKKYSVGVRKLLNSGISFQKDYSWKLLLAAVNCPPCLFDRHYIGQCRKGNGHLHLMLVEMPRQ
jgi:hypothetical protein